MSTFHSSEIGPFAQNVLGVPLYPYQLEIAEAILDSIVHERGQIFTVMMARQSGKNQLSAVLEAFVLAHMSKGTIVKAAPTFNPQIYHSQRRLADLLNGCELGERMWQSSGRSTGLAPDGEIGSRKNHIGPRVAFFSASPESNVVGATADLLLEIDEAQEVASEKFDRDFRPMCSSTNSTTVLYGTAWSDQTLLAQQRAVNLEEEQRTGLRQHFEHDWRTLAALNPRYRAFVEREIARLGEEHIAIQTQYFLRPVNGLERLFNARQLGLLQGEHAWEEAPLGEEIYLAGMDIGGEDSGSPGALIGLPHAEGRSRHDSTVISIARLRRTELQLPQLEVVYQESWVGMSYSGQFAAAIALVGRWRVRTLVVDATGLGAPLASMLRERLGEERVRPFTFTRGSKSKLAYQFLSFVNSGQLKLYARGETAWVKRASEECWQQLRLAKYRMPAQDVLDMYVEPSEGHDDILMSLALLTEAAGTLAIPAASTLVRPRRLYSEEGRF
jgi:hypothetical protein